MSHFLRKVPAMLFVCTNELRREENLRQFLAFSPHVRQVRLRLHVAPRRRDHRGVPNVLSLVQYDNSTRRVNDLYVNSTLLWLGYVTKPRAAYTVVGFARPRVRFSDT